MDDDPMMSGGVGTGVMPNEPDQPKQTASDNSAAVAASETNNDAGETAETNTSVDPTGNQPLVDRRKTTPPAANEAMVLGRPAAESRYADHDINLPHGDKSSLGKIIAIVGGAIGVVLIGVIAWFVGFYNQPNKVAFDAINKFFQAENVATTGSVVALYDEDAPFQYAILNITSSASSLPTVANATLLLTPQDGSEEAIQVSLDAIALADGMAYVELSGLTEALNEVAVMSGEEESVSAFLDTLDEIEGDWWEIDISELMTSLGWANDDVAGTEAIYTCAVNTVSTGWSNELAALYRDHQFITAQRLKTIVTSDGNVMEPRSGHNYYLATVDKTALAEFINNLPYTTAALGFIDCYNEAVSNYELYEPINLEDLTEVSEDDLGWLDEKQVYLEISRFGHELKSILIEQTDGETAISSSFIFDYVPASAIEAPEEYRTSSELAEQLTLLFSDFSSWLSGDPEIIFDSDDEDDSSYYDEESDIFYWYDDDDWEDED